MGTLFFVSHPQVIVDAQVPIPSWRLSAVGLERAEGFARYDLLRSVTAIWSSAEAKASQTAGCLADRLGFNVQIEPNLGENDRSATGFLEPAAFEAAADAFFSQPEVSFKGWERAVDAQKRIRQAVSTIVDQHQGGDLAIVSHGAVGTLLYCALRDLPISRDYDQPGQGHYWTADLSDLVPRHGWKSIG